MAEDKIGEELPTEEEVLYYMESLDRLFRDLGKLSIVLENMIGAGEPMKHLCPDNGLGVLQGLKASVDAARPTMQALALEILDNSQDTQNGQKD